MTTTFKIQTLSPGRAPLTNPDVRSNIQTITKFLPEAAGCNIDKPNIIVPGEYGNAMNGFLQACYTAFANHQHLILSPDDVWIAIAQGFSCHVNVNAEALRRKFVQHDGKKYIEIQRNEFVKGSADNDWMGGFAEFSDRIAEYIGDTRGLIVSDFSTTGPIEKAASEVVLMDTVKAYFDYGCRTRCGIPDITLLGEPADWANLVHRAMRLTEFDEALAPWVRSLTIVLGEFVKASKGHPDLAFWKSFFKEGGGSGGPYINGAVCAFFPYVKNYGRDGGEFCLNKYAVEWQNDRGCFHGMTTEAVPSGLCSVPFRWIYYTQVFPMSFFGGFVGAHHDAEANTVRPAIGWAVTDRKEHASVDDLDINQRG